MRYSCGTQDMPRRPSATFRTFQFCLILACGTSSAVTPACAQSAAVTARSPSQAESGEIDVERSRVFVHVKKTGLGHEHAVVGRLKSGRLELGAALEAGELVFDMRSYRADNEEASRFLGFGAAAKGAEQRQVSRTMLGPEVLDVARHPTAEFKIDSAVRLATAKDEPARYELKGALSLHGTSRPLSVQVTAVEDGKRTKVSGRFTVLQSDFGIRPYRKGLGAVGVADRLTIHGELWLATSPDAADR